MYVVLCLVSVTCLLLNNTFFFWLKARRKERREMFLWKTIAELVLEDKRYEDWLVILVLTRLKEGHVST